MADNVDLTIFFMTCNKKVSFMCHKQQQTVTMTDMDIFKSTLTNSELNFITTARQHYFLLPKLLLQDVKKH